ncbi:hypothetical protein Tsubulata_028386 [Turnera subulata]|uniref:Uncharacterized protein n=1 Tax=Turnera subulata TaxID=218843 RepID=A0A9Q0FCU0_9ROSI|nr:hypothetical protein Tsubulata_028386 [Turnera subulata]
MLPFLHRKQECSGIKNKRVRLEGSASAHSFRPNNGSLGKSFHFLKPSESQFNLSLTYDFTIVLSLKHFQGSIGSKMLYNSRGKPWPPVELHHHQMHTPSMVIRAQLQLLP